MCGDCHDKLNAAIEEATREILNKMFGTKRA